MWGGGGGGGGGWRKWLYFTFLKKTNYVTKFYTQKMQKLNNLTLQFFNEKFLFRIDSKKNYFFMQKMLVFFVFREKEFWFKRKTNIKGKWLVHNKFYLSFIWIGYSFYIYWNLNKSFLDNKDIIKENSQVMKMQLICVLTHIANVYKKKIYSKLN